MTLAPLRSVSLILAAVFLAAAAQAHDHDHAKAQPDAKAQGASAPLDAHARADMERHRAMAKAHEAAAQCLAAGRDHEQCQKQLQADCKGLALGKFCGMRHAH
ncbi:conserved hypothetical protein [Delftia acidovorans SPH-1]|uniref:Uncharacterized protein n=1 Tax=Delftia acidovorans (strain DSM 14801 / SPH-1) TaxID=398578 RepID=A9BWQ4_DELAS|nr:MULTISPECIES: hypothetical protein [Delftia]MBA4006304.1 hypothetical protein [Delftia sp.]ABX36581.1 conserved hypothetical protein [Delftia acidovorans SPH-1]MBN9322913.1 hypothetical protein [Delftia acidovorans]MCP4015179.1 hypothetical protein [Delftia sp.]MCP4516242.1 hypothetical protein [Delftia sp.]